MSGHAPPTARVLCHVKERTSEGRIRVGAYTWAPRFFFSSHLHLGPMSIFDLPHTKLPRERHVSEIHLQNRQRSRIEQF